MKKESLQEQKVTEKKEQQEKWKAWVEETLASMTLEEKLGQLNQVGPKAVSTLAGYEVDIPALLAKMFAGEISEEEFRWQAAMQEEDLREEEIRAGRLGSFIGLYDREKINHVQQIAREESRLGIPLLIGVDVVRGYKTIFPTPLAESCSWDLERMEESAAIAAKEARAEGVNWTFAPMVDVARDARWGRIVEGSGEDAWLCSRIAEAKVRGFQGEDRAAEDKLIACAKHFLAYGAASGGQDYNTVAISTQQLYEVYLPPFRAAVEAGVGSVMSAFHDLNGIPCTTDRWLLRQVLRQELGFRGVVVSDAEAVQQCVSHGTAESEAEAARQALLAGGDIDMSSEDYIRFLEKEIQEGRLSEEAVDEAVRRVLEMKAEGGLLEKEARKGDEEAAQILLCPEHRQAARELAERSMVLLTNRGILPLSVSGGEETVGRQMEETGQMEGAEQTEETRRTEAEISNGRMIRKLAVIGPLADNQEESIGPWSFTGDCRESITVLSGLRQRLADTGCEIRYAKGCEIEGEDTSGFAEAKRLAEEADVVVAVLGERLFMSGEAASRADLNLPGVQRELLAALKETGTPIVLCLINGRPLTIGWEKEQMDAILECWQPGIECGNAVASVLFGDYNPSGHLTVTFPNTAGQEPMYYNHPATGKPGGPFKFTSKYLDAPVEPLFPFGYGLSYTSFALENLRLSAKELTIAETLLVSAEVTNTGNCFGETVVQLYVHDRTASMTRPVKELKGFVKLGLEPGESKTVTVPLPMKELQFYNRAMELIWEPGWFDVWLGEDSASGLYGEFYLS